MATARVEPLEAIVAAGAAIGDFELIDELGRGAMGIVYRARQRSLDRVVALKVLPPALAADEVTLARFRREIAALARCEHPNVVKILSSGVDGDRYFYAMEFVDGADLALVSRRLAEWSTDRSSAIRRRKRWGRGSRRRVYLPSPGLDTSSFASASCSPTQLGGSNTCTNAESCIAT
jgi:serine/threonine protein kinase